MGKSTEVPPTMKNRQRTTLWPSNPLVGMYPKETKSITWKDVCTPTFFAALFTTAVIRKQPKCLSGGERARKRWCLYTKGCYEAVGKEGNPVLCRNIEEPGGYYTEWNMPEKDKRFVIVCFSVEPKKEKKRSKREKAPMLWKQKVEWWLPGAGRVGETGRCGSKCANSQ